MKYFKFCLFILFSLVLSFTFKISVKADSIFSIDSVSMTDKSTGVISNGVSFSDNIVKPDVKLYKMDDYVTYKITIKNNESKKYKVLSISDDNDSKYVLSSYEYNDKIDPNSTFDIFLTFKLNKYVDDLSILDSNGYYSVDSIKTFVTLIDEKEETSVIEVITNPNTYDPVGFYFILLFVLLIIASIVLFFKNKKLFSLITLVLSFLSIIPVFADNKTSIELVIDSGVQVKVDTFTYMYDLEEKKYISNVTNSVDGTINERDGYTFNYWIDGNSNQYNYGEEIVNKEDSILISVYTPIIYNITYDLDGGTVSTVNPVLYNIETPTFTINNPAKEAYTFKGWKVNGSTSINDNLIINAGSIGNLSLKAIYEPIKYNITYDLDGGKSDNPSVYTIEDNITLQYPVKDGYTFVGWTSSNLSDVTKDVTINGQTGDKSYKAIYKLSEYNVNINANGGNNDVVGKVLHTKKVVTIDTELPYKTVNVTFDKSTIDGAIFGDTSSIESKVYAGSFYIDQNLETQLLYTSDGNINFLSSIDGYTDDDGFIKKEDITVYASYDNPDVIVLPSVKKNGYICGWAEGTDSQMYVGNYYPSSYNVNLVAVCRSNSYTLNVNPDGGKYNDSTNVTSITGEYEETVSLSTPTKAGYKFIGWNLDGNGTLSSDNSSYTFSSSNDEITAMYEEETYELTVDLLGGEVNGKSSSLYFSGKKGETVSIPTPSLDNARFNKWVLTGDGTINESSYTFGSSNDTLTAEYIYTKDFYDIYSDAVGGKFELYSTDSSKIRISNGSGGTIYSSFIIEPLDSITINASKTGRYQSISVILYDGDTKLTSILSSSQIENSVTYVNNSGSSIDALLVGSGTNASALMTIKDKNNNIYDYNISGIPVEVKSSIKGLTYNGKTSNTFIRYYNVGEEFGEHFSFSNSGYSFDGFYANNEYTGERITKDYVITENQTIYLKAIPNTYGLTVNPAGGIWNGSSEIQTFTQDMNSTKSIDVPVKEGYVFTGWTLTGPGTITTSKPIETQTQTFTFKDGTTTITANYESISSSLTIDLDGGEYSGQTSYQGNYKDTIEITSIPTKTGYAFTGFEVVSGNGSILENVFTFGYTNTVLKATYEATPYTLTLELDGGTISDYPVTQSIVYNNDYLINRFPVKEGYIFTGWALSGKGTLSNRKPYATTSQVLTAGDGDSVLTATYVEEFKPLYITKNKSFKFISFSAGTISGSIIQSAFFNGSYGNGIGYMFVNPGDNINFKALVGSNNGMPTNSYYRVYTDTETIYRKDITTDETDQYTYVNNTNEVVKIYVELYTNDAATITLYVSPTTSSGVKYKVKKD